MPENHKIAMLGNGLIGIFTMTHYASGRGNSGHSLKNAASSLGLIFVGPGKYSLDALIRRRKQPPPE